jgi:ABC-type multidrug transport system fused ATPase/permease subunit
LASKSKEPTPFQRLFSYRDLVRGAPLGATLLYAASSLLLCFLLVDLCLTVDLLVRGGRLIIAQAERPEINALIGQDVLSADGDPTPGPEADQLTYADRGLLPTIWHFRNRFFTSALVAAYVRFSPLRHDLQALVTLVALAALFGWLRSIFESRARIGLLNVGHDVAARLRRSIHRQTLRLGPSDLEGRSGAHAMQLFTTEVDRLRDGVYRWAERVGRDPLRLILFLGLALAVDPLLALICLAPIALCWYIAYNEAVRTEQVRTAADEAAARELRVLAESLERTRLVRGFGMEAFEQDQFQKYLDRFQESASGVYKAKAWSRRAIRTIVAACMAFVFLFVGSKILLPPPELSFAAGLLMITALAVAWFPLQSLMARQREHEAAELAARRIQDYLNLIPEVGQAVGAKFLQPLSKMIAFDNVSYTTPSKRQLLEGLKLKIPAGRQVAIVASDPLEGLAVAYLLPRFIEPQSGRILIDGEDIAWVTLESLRAEAVFVGGKDPFLTGTVRDNISGGNATFSLQDVTEAAKVAHAHNFIQKLSQGYETVIGEHGEMLDAGQGFRLGLARAILRKPALLVIEEPADSLDEDTKSMLDDAYKRIAVNRTVIFLPQRLSTLKKVDEIVLIHKGRLAAIAPHSRLVQSSPLYRHWEYMHFNEFRHEFETE